MEWIKQPWPWYISGPLIGLMVPTLLLLGNKPFGLSSSLKHLCAMCSPVKVDFFDYDWKEEIWNLVLVGGIVLGGYVAHAYLMPEEFFISFSPDLSAQDTSSFAEIQVLESRYFSWEALQTWQGIVFLVFGGFLVGFGTRYADGCTSGHAIMGLSILNWPSLVAIAGFFVGGLISTHLIIPYFLLP